MAMTIRTDGGDMMSEMNTTPLIDVMLVLLTLLIITLPMQTNAVRLTLPHGSDTGPPPPAVTIAIDFDGGLAWDGRAVTRDQLDALLVRASRQTPQPDIRIDADRLAHYDIVAKVLSDAQRSGLQRIGFVHTAEYEAK